MWFPGKSFGDNYIHGETGHIYNINVRNNKLSVVCAMKNMDLVSHSERCIEEAEKVDCSSGLNEVHRHGPMTWEMLEITATRWIVRAKYFEDPDRTPNEVMALTLKMYPFAMIRNLKYLYNRWGGTVTTAKSSGRAYKERRGTTKFYERIGPGGLPRLKDFIEAMKCVDGRFTCFDPPNICK